MSGYRAFFNEVSDGEIFLTPEESRHLCGSLRARDGDEVDAFDMCGRVFSCEIAKSSQKCAVLKIISEKKIKKNAAEIFIAQAMPKGKVFDEIIRETSEIGGCGVIPLLAEHCEVKIRPEDLEKKAQKWNVQAVEAVKQSGNFSFSKIPQAQKLSDFLASPKLETFNLLIVASLRENALPLLQTLENFSTPSAGENLKICILIGPEGDFSNAEYDEIERAGFKPSSLGKCVMRCDTAASAALAVACAHFANIRHFEK